MQLTSTCLWTQMRRNLQWQTQHNQTCHLVRRMQKQSLHPRNQRKAGKWGLLKFTMLSRVGIKSGRKWKHSKTPGGSEQGRVSADCSDITHWEPEEWWRENGRKFTTMKKKDKASGFSRGQGQTGKELLLSQSSRTVFDYKSFSERGNRL